MLTKTPVPILLFAAGEFITGKSLFAARMVNSVFSIATVIPLFLLLKLLIDKRAAWIGVVIWLLGSGTIMFHTMGHTQVIASFFAVSCLWLFMRVIGSQKIIPTYILYAGICFALAYASRKTAIAISVPIILSWIILRGSWQGVAQAIRMFLLGVLVICIPWVISMYAVYGLPGIWHVLGFGYGDILVHSQSIEAWAGSSDHMFAEAARIGFVYGLLLIVVCFSIMRERVLIGASWIATLALLYWLWPTHLVEYLADFIPAIVIAGAISVAGPRFASPVLLTIFLLINIISLRSVYIRPWTGMFTRDAIHESATWLAEHVPKQEEIFTAAVIIPYISGHHVPFNLSHPQWYGYSFISDQDKHTFLPPYFDIQKTVDAQVSWALREQITDYVYPGMSLNGFQEVHSVPNNTKYRQNTLRVYLKHEH